MKKILLAIFIGLVFLILPNKVNAQVIDNVNAPNTQREIERALREECAGDVTCAALAGQRYLAGLGFSSRIEGDCSTFPGCTLVCDNGSNVRISIPAPPTAAPTRTPQGGQSPCPPHGDVNSSGSINQQDVIEYNKYLARLQPRDFIESAEFADTDGDGDFDSDDRNNIAQFIEGSIFTFSVCQEPSPTQTPTPTSIPNACNVDCTYDSECQADIYSSSNTCTACVNNKCQVPLSPTPVPACNASCNSDSYCQNANDGCTDCNPTTNRCQLPSPTPTNVPPPPTSTPTPTRIPPPTATPTPAFNPDSCKCDNIEFTTLASGQPTTITAYGKVEGADIQRAKVVSTKFTLYKSVGGSVSGNPILAETVPATVVSSTPQLVKYKSVWNFTVPNLEKGADYRIGAVVNDAGTCQPKTTALNTQATQTTSVLAGTTQNLSFWDRALNFVNSVIGFFGGGRSTAPALTPTITPVSSTDSSVNNISVNDVPTPTIRKQLQLEPIYPVIIIQKTCNFIKFYNPFY